MKSSPERIDELTKARALLHTEALDKIRQIKKTLTAVENALRLEGPVFPIYTVEARDAMDDLLYLYAKDAALWGVWHAELFRDASEAKKARKKR